MTLNHEKENINKKYQFNSEGIELPHYCGWSISQHTFEALLQLKTDSMGERERTDSMGERERTNSMRED
jgi:hypothetical protein